MADRLCVWRVYNGMTAACCVHRVVVAYTMEGAVRAAEEAGMEGASLDDIEVVCEAVPQAAEAEDYRVARGRARP